MVFQSFKHWPFIDATNKLDAPNVNFGRKAEKLFRSSKDGLRARDAKARL